MTGITLLGLGPGSADLLTRQAWQVLENAAAAGSEVYLRTRLHPAVEGLPSSLNINSFDHYYEEGQSFEAVYDAIVEQILELARRPQGVIYAVPGHPFVAEATGPEIARRARQEGIPLRVIEGLSFLEPVFSAIGIDPLSHTALVDALELAGAHTPSFPPDAPAIIAQIHSRAVASDVKLTLMEVYPDTHPVRLVHAAGTNQQRVEDIPLYEIDRSEHIGLLTTLYVPALGPGTSLEAFQEVIAHLRAPNGCPWDREQTHLTLRPYLLEEVYELLAALDAEDAPAACEEFGDLLLQIVLHAQIANEEGEYRMADIIQGIYAKIIRRHPHVFGDLELADAQGVLQNWEKLKATERASKGQAEKGLLDSISVAMPALMQAQEYQKRVKRVGFDWQDIDGVIRKVDEEMTELRQAEGQAERTSELGDVLFAVVNLARWYRVDAESALREANGRFRNRFAYIEQQARQTGRSLQEMTLDEMDRYWGEAKKQGR